MKNLYLILTLCLPFSIIASLMVFLISFKEYQHHFFDRKKVIKMSLEASFLTIVFFVILILVISTILNNYFLK